MGARRRACVLERPDALERLLESLAGIDRLVLLGDVIELVESRAAVTMPKARPILDAICGRLDADREIVLVPGNHDRPLIRGWLRRNGRSLGVATAIPLNASAALEHVTGWLGRKRVTVSYPGAWLADGVWATHGHYLDRHLIPASNWGRLRGRRGAAPAERTDPWQYERIGRTAVGSVLRWLPGPAAASLNGVSTFLRARTMPAIHQGVLDPRIAPVVSRLLSLQMRRHALPALGRVVRRLGVEASWVVFGHVHRLGPLESDDPEQWRSSEAGPRFVNTGSWLYEPRLVHGVTPPHPYWPGGAVFLEDGEAPRAIGLLDEASFSSH